MSIRSNTEEAAGGGALLRRLIEFVRARGFAPGDRLPAERELAAHLGVGRNALREALATLETLRVVESRPQSGVYLRTPDTDSSFETIVLFSALGGEPTADEVRESIEARALLEEQAITLACERRDATDLAALGDVLARTDAVLAEGGNIADCDQAFHLALARAAHNSVLTRMLNAFYCLSLPRRQAFFADPARGAVSAREHARIVAAVTARDAERARMLIARHMGSAQVYWRDALGGTASAQSGAAAAAPVASARRARTASRQGAKRRRSGTDL